FFFFFQAEDGILDFHVTGVQTCALPICSRRSSRSSVVTSALKRRSPSTVSARRYELVLLLTTPGDVGSAEESAKQHEPERIEGTAAAAFLRACAAATPDDRWIRASVSRLILERNLRELRAFAACCGNEEARSGIVQ